MTDSDQTRTKITLKDSSGTSEGAEIPQKPLVNVSIPFVDQQNQIPPNEPENDNVLLNKIYVEKIPPGYIAGLKSSISILNRRISVLREEYKKNKLNIIRSSEIALIKSQIQYYHSQDSIIQIQDLMNRYTETMRNNSALKALCLNLEKRIAYEEQRRSILIEEINLLDNSYNLSETVTIEPPKINKLEDLPDKAEQLEIQALKQKLILLQNQLKEIQSEPNYEMNAIAFKEVVKSVQMESNLRQIGTNELNEEIENLKKELNNSNDMINMITNKNMKKRQKSETKSHEYYQKEKEMAENFQIQVQKYKEKIIKDNEKIESLRGKLERIQTENQMIYKEIDRINDLPKPRKFINDMNNKEEEEDLSSNNENDNSESENFEDSQINQANKQLLITLNQQIFQLRSEIHDLNQQYFFLKTNINDSQNKKIKYIRSLNEKHQKNLEKIEKIKLKNRVAPTTKDKEEIDSISQILTKIHGSIEEINSSIIGDNA